MLNPVLTKQTVPPQKAPIESRTPDASQKTGLTDKAAKKRSAVAQYAEALDHLNEVLDALCQQPSGTSSVTGENLPTTNIEALRRVVDRVSRELESWPLAIDPQNKVTGLPTDFLNRIFAEFVRRGRGRELSPRQRRMYIAPFNAVREALQPHVAVSLESVKNHLRGPRALPVQTRINAFVPPSVYDKIMAALLEDVFSTQRADAQRWFQRAVLLTILRLGVTFSGCVQALSWIRLQDLHRDFIIVPRDAHWRRWLLVWLDDATALAWHALVIARARLPTLDNRRKCTVQPTNSYMPLASDTGELLNTREQKALRQRLGSYLAELCTSAGVEPISLTQTMQMTRFI